MKRNMIALGTSLLFLISGCAMLDYRQAAPDLHISTKERLSIGVQDHRPYVLNHDKEENFIGIQRGGFGIPVSLPTASGHPLAEDMTYVIVKSFSSTEAIVNSMKIPPEMSMDSILQIANSQQADKIILLTLLNWKTDTYQSTDLIYDSLITVFDAKGNILATNKIHGSDMLGKNILAPQSVPIKFAPIALQQKLEELFNGNIVEALSAPRNQQ